MAAEILIGKAETAQFLPLKYANRHGLIAGATGTGKTVTLQILVEGFSDAGVPVFLADVKGDLAGLSRAGEPKDALIKRAADVGLAPYAPRAFPTTFWDLFGEQGARLRATISEMGPLLLARLLDLNDTQEGVLTLAFRYADDRKLALLDLKDLRALLAVVAEDASELTTTYGNVSKATVGAIQRRLLALEEQGAEKFFGEPALALADLMRVDADGKGAVNILAADKLMQTPKLYATFLLWLLSELFEELPEVGDLPQPKLVFFFDEAHLLFNDAPKSLVEKIEQVTRLIRSKGVGIFFVTQNPLDIPNTVSSQLGNRILHALRAYTPAEQKVIKAAAETFRANPAFKAEDVIPELGIGEALVSTLSEGGAPSPAARTKIRPPQSRMGAVTAGERLDLLNASALKRKYETTIDTESAYELLTERAARKAAAQTPAAHPTPRPYAGRQTVVEAAMKSAVRTLSTRLVNEIVRGVFGTMRRGGW